MFEFTTNCGPYAAGELHVGVLLLHQQGGTVFQPFANVFEWKERKDKGGEPQAQFYIQSFTSKLS